MPDIILTSRRQIAIALALLLPAAMASAVELLRPKPLMEYHDILLAQELDSALAVLNDRWSNCKDATSEKPEACACRHPEAAKNAADAYDKVVQARPKWKGKILYWKNPDNQESRQLVMPAIDHQLKAGALDCTAAAVTH